MPVTTALRPNPSLKRSDDGRTPGPGWRKCTAYRQTGPGGLPLALRLSEGLGLNAVVTGICLAGDVLATGV